MHVTFIITTTIERMGNAKVQEFIRRRIPGPIDLTWDAQLLLISEDGLGAAYSDWLFAHLPDTSEMNTPRTVVFMHDDLFIEDAHWYNKLRWAMANFDVVGLAGATNYIVTEYALWHHVTPAWHSGMMVHPAYTRLHEDATSREIQQFRNHRYVRATSYGITPAKCAVVDGCFLAVEINAVRHYKFSFDARFTRHFYDLDFCLSANQAGASVGTWPIHAMHLSPGLGSYEDPEFVKNLEVFKEKWGPEGHPYFPRSW